MAQMMLAAFTDPTEADRAISELEQRGYTPQQISVISKDAKYETQGHIGTDDALTSAGHGATTGGIIGGLAGLLAGVGIVPAIAGLFIAGPLVGALGLAGIAATTASGALTGAAAGGLIGALTKAGVSKETATSYDEIVQHGGVVLGLTGDDEMTDEARSVLDANGARDISLVDMNNSPARDHETQDAQGYPSRRAEPSFGERRELPNDREDL